MSSIFIKPGVDDANKPLFVRDPETHVPLAAEGEWKPRSAFWLHRLRDRDVIEIAPLPAPEKKTKSSLPLATPV